MSDVGAGGGDGGQGTLRGVLPAGTSLRGYELKSILGQGAFGITYRARDLTLNRDVAVKEYLPTSLALREGRTTVLPRSPDHAEQFAWGRERFLDEARTLARLDRTPAIVRVHDFLEANGTAYMVMALIEGETLAKRLTREQRLMPEAVERLVFPLLDGLEEVHAIGFLHRDIKPANIMVDTHGRPTLIDFGASRAAMAERSTTLTAIFTPGYAAAEQFTSAALGPWSDIYGLAATLYHAITGKIPPSAIDRILQDTYEPLSDLQPEGFSPGLLAAIDAGLAIRVDDRPQSIAEWRQMLRSATPALEATRIARKPSRLGRAARSTRRAGITLKGPALVGAVAAVFLLLAGGGYLAFNAGAPTDIGALSAEQLEQALAERRKADALASEKRRLEEEARRKADADAEAMRQADAELEQARQARQKAEEELARLKADIEARRQSDPWQRDQAAVALQRSAEEDAQRKAEAEASALREAEEEAATKAAAETEAKRQADEALAVAESQRKQAEAEARTRGEAEAAARRRASEEAQRKAEADAATRRAADEAQAKAQAEREKAEAEAKIRADAQAEADKAAAILAKLKEEGETAEKSLALTAADRERLQLALTSLRFDTRGNDGILGPRSREMIAAWQKARNDPPTGFLTGAQQQALLKEAATALSKYDEQKKAEEEEAKARLAAATTSSAPLSSPDGLWRGTLECGGRTPQPLEARLTNGSGTWYPPHVSPASYNTFSLAITVDGFAVSVVQQERHGSVVSGGRLVGRYDGNSIRANDRRCTMALTRDGAPVAAAKDAVSAYDGTYSGQGSTKGPTGMAARSHVSLKVTNGRGTGTINSPGCTPSSFSTTMSATGGVTGEGYLNCVLGSGTTTISAGPLAIFGDAEGKNLNLRFRTDRGEFGAMLAPGTPVSPALAAVSLPDGTYSGAMTAGATLLHFSVRMLNGSGSGTAARVGCGPLPLTLRTEPSGTLTGEASLVFGSSCNSNLTPLTGRVEGGRLILSFATGEGGGGIMRREVVLSRGGEVAALAPPSPDGLWRGTYKCDGAPSVQSDGREPFSLDIQVRLVNGSGTWKSINARNTFDVTVSVDQGRVTSTRAFTSGQTQVSGRGILSGRYDGNTISAIGIESNPQRSCELVLTRV